MLLRAPLRISILAGMLATFVWTSVWLSADKYAVAEGIYVGSGPVRICRLPDPAEESLPNPVQNAPELSGLPLDEREPVWPKQEAYLPESDFGLPDFNVDVKSLTASMQDDRSKDLFRAAAPGWDPKAGWAPRQFSWCATEFWHQPLYFEDAPLERYGQSCHPLLQPLVSGFKFFSDIVILPYRLGLDNPFCLVPALGYHRPGSPAPCTKRRLPLETEAMWYEVALIAGVILLIP